MPIETLAQAYFARWRVTARCAYGIREATKSIRGVPVQIEYAHAALDTRPGLPTLAPRKPHDVSMVPVATRAAHLPMYQASRSH
jgi:hypothetical protein